MPTSTATRRRGRPRRGRRRVMTARNILHMRMTTGLYALRFNVNIASNLAGVISFHTSLSSPSRAINGTNTYIDWDFLKNLYDAYRVTSVKINFQPHFPNDTSITTGYRAIYFAADYNTIGVSPVSKNEVSAYDNMQVRNLFRPFTIKYRNPKGGVIPQTNPVISRNGKMYYTVDTIGLGPDVGYIMAYTDGVDALTTYGEATFHIVLDLINRK